MPSHQAYGYPCAGLVLPMSRTKTPKPLACVALGCGRIFVGLVGVRIVGAIVEAVRDAVVVRVLAGGKGRLSERRLDLAEHARARLLTRLRLGGIAVHRLAIGVAQAVDRSR